eukprot:2040304-Amphidinium_carterae.1
MSLYFVILGDKRGVWQKGGFCAVPPQARLPKAKPIDSLCSSIGRKHVTLGRHYLVFSRIVNTWQDYLRVHFSRSNSCSGIARIMKISSGTCGPIAFRNTFSFDLECSIASSEYVW